MISLLTAILAVLIATAPADITPHTSRAHEKNTASVKRHLIPNLQGYDSISSQVLDHLGFMKDVEQITETLDTFRRGALGRALENSMSGAKWVTTAWDELRELVGRVDRSRAELALLKKRTSIVLMAAQEYVNSADQHRFQTLTTVFDDATPVFDQAHDALGELRRFMGIATGSFDYANTALKTMKDTPLVGKYLQTLVKQLDGVKTRIQAAGKILLMAQDAIARDKKLVTALREVMAEGRAHDAYDHADALVARGKVGTALTAFTELRQVWPDTAWAHRADRRIVEIVAYVDSMRRESAALQMELAELTEAMSKNSGAAASDRPGGGTSTGLMGLCLVLLIVAGGLATTLWRVRAKSLEQP